MVRLAACFLAVTALAGQPQPPADRQFVDPPPESRMASYWWVFGPAWTQPEIDRHLAIFEKAGIGRLLIFPLYPHELDDPQRGIRNLKYLSPEFLGLLRHAIKTANARGIEVDLVMGTGWPYGGPTVPQALSPRRLYMVAGPAGSDPARPPEHEEVAAVLKTDRETLTFIQGLTVDRHKVIYSAYGAGGYSIDHLDKRAVELYLRDVGSQLAGAAKGLKVRAMYSASFEVNGTSWTPGFLGEFQRRRGYDLTPHLAALFRDEGEKTPHVRHDFWETISGLAEDNYMRTVGEWCRAHGFGFQAESYGAPPVTLSSFAATDYPMGEDYTWKESNRCRWASAGGHYFGKNIISVEAFTWLRPARYSESLQDVKLASDLHFLSGANRIVAHGYGYSPRSAAAPGWGYYAGVMLTEHNPWWRYFPIVSKYVHRVSYVLSLGRHVVDVALYLPEGDVFADTPPGPLNLGVANRRLHRSGPARRGSIDQWGVEVALASEADLVKNAVVNGYNLEPIDHSILQSVARPAAGRLQAGLSSFPIVVVPGVRGLPLADLEVLAEFCRQGGTLITTAALPRLAYGFQRREQNARRFGELIDELYGGLPAAAAYHEKPVGRGRSIFARDEKENYLRALRTCPPDVQLSGAGDDVGFYHRSTGAHDYYFVANASPRQQTLQASFRVGHRRPRLWDAMTGTIRNAPSYSCAGGRTEVPLNLEPFGSIIVEFGESSAPPTQPAPAPQPGRRSFELAGPWKVTWPGSAMAPKELTQLRSWTEYPELRHYSGRAVYETTFRLPSEPGPEPVLDLGVVRETAEVWVNGKRAGVAWRLPYRLPVKGYLKPGENRLRIEVANLLINLVLSRPPMDYSRIRERYGVGFGQPRDLEPVKEPFPSGLLGPVRLEP